MRNPVTDAALLPVRGDQPPEQLDQHPCDPVIWFNAHGALRTALA